MKMDFKLYVLPCIKQQTCIDNLKCEFGNNFFLNYAHAWYINTSWAKSGMERWIIIISKIQLVVYYQCRILIGWA